MHSAPSTAPGHYGADGAGRLALREATIFAAWNVQGDPARSDFMDEARQLFALALPIEVNATAKKDGIGALWLGPASWLLVSGFPVAEGHLLTEFHRKRDALNAVGGALFDVSVSRVGWTVSGSHAATLVGKGSPLDFHSRVFPPGACAQSVYGHMNALFYKHADDAITILVARSFAHDVWSALCAGAAQYGYEVLPPAGFVI